ncbi:MULTISPECIES: LysR family transcriptional regulator [unclassified Nocardia]|uniref:LysR family transcriptional regulator n=1 Tax=unclassified Nocardia TaxID=2637762 RepID=UPI0035E145BC
MSARPDLNLLVALHALLEERHVSRAAARIGVSQPAASAMLARLRRHFDDDLLERVGNHYELTPLGTQLREQAGGVMQLSDRLFDTKSQFDPATSDREFVLTVSDYLVAVLGPSLLSAFEAQAPHASLRLRQFIKPSELHSDASARSEDGLIAPHGAFPLGVPSSKLFSDEWVALVDRDNPIAEHPPTAEQLPGLHWVLGQYEPGEPTFMMRRLAERGVLIRPRAVIDRFVALPLLVAGTDRIAIIQKRLTQAINLPPTLRVIACPFDAGPINEALWWHSVHTFDSGHQWFRTLVRDTARALDTPAETGAS